MEGFTENALKILRARYFKKDENGEVISSLSGTISIPEAGFYSTTALRVSPGGAQSITVWAARVLGTRSIRSK